MAERKVASYGSWISPFPIARLTDGVVGLGEVRAAGGIRWWLEGRPAEGGRQVLVRRDEDGAVTRLTPEGFNVRSRVQEYGGTPYAVHGETVIVSDFVTGRLQRLVRPGLIEPLTSERAWRFADLTVDAGRGRLLAIREDHEPATLERHGEAENSIVAVDLGTGEVTELLSGADFYGAPRLSPDGARLAWLEWRHPNMPWDGTLLRLAELDAAGRPGAPITIAGGPSDWIAQPRWSPEGILHYVAEPDGWMNIYRWLGTDAPPRNLTPIAAEFAPPDWVLGTSSYGFAADGSVIAIGRGGGRSRLYRIAPVTLELTAFDLRYHELSGLAVDGDRVVMRAGAPAEPSAIVDLDLALAGGTAAGAAVGAAPATAPTATSAPMATSARAVTPAPTAPSAPAATGAIRVLRRAISSSIDPADVSTGRHISFPTSGGKRAFANFYPPHNRAFRAPEGELPPLIVTSHGGPTAEASSALSLTFQLLTSRGFAVLDVDYGGSTGYGRDYRRRLEGQWGVVDVDDCVNGARWLAAEGLVDAARMAVRGGSASGYLALCAVTFRDDFAAGVSYFGIGDLETFDTITHKFESKYTQRLVGPYPERRDLYHDRSPLNFVDQIHCPLLILQGLDDRVVPPAQAEQIVASLRARGLPYAYLAFEGEDHGFRQAKNIIRSFEAELSFYGQVFGFVPGDPIEPVEIVNLPASGRRSE